MSDRLFKSAGQLRRALDRDISDMEKMKREGFDTSGINQVIENKKKMLSLGTWRD